MSKKFKVKLTRRNSNDSLPYNVEEVVHAFTSKEAHELAKLRYPGYEAEWFDIVEVKDSARSGVRSSSSSSGGVGSLASIAGLIVVGVLLWKSSDIRQYVSEMKQASGPAVDQLTTDPTEQAAWGAPQVAPHSGSVVGMDPTPRPAPAKSASEESGVEQPGSHQLPTTPATSNQARIVDSRDQIVLQSGPKMSAKNVAKIDSGSVVEVLSRDGKWVEVRTKDDLVGYVRSTQLEPLD